MGKGDRRYSKLERKKARKGEFMDYINNIFCRNNDMVWTKKCLLYYLEDKHHDMPDEKKMKELQTQALKEYYPKLFKRL